jgi:hypothetical protein
MGGCGSGRRNGATKRRVESCLALDVNELRRQGALTPGASGTLTWSRDEAASVALNVLAYNMKRVMAIIGVAALLEASAA